MRERIWAAVAAAASLMTTVAAAQERASAVRAGGVSVSALFPGTRPPNVKTSSASPSADAPPVVDALFLPNSPPKFVQAAALETSGDLPPPVPPPETPAPPMLEPRIVAKPIRILSVRAAPRAAPALLGLDEPMRSLTRQSPPTIP